MSCAKTKKTVNCLVHLSQSFDMYTNEGSLSAFFIYYPHCKGLNSLEMQLPVIIDKPPKKKVYEDSLRRARFTLMQSDDTAGTVFKVRRKLRFGDTALESNRGLCFSREEEIFLHKGKQEVPIRVLSFRPNVPSYTGRVVASGVLFCSYNPEFGI